MNKQEYEQKRAECWENFKFARRPLNTDKKVFDYIFDRAYALGKQTETITHEEIERAAVEYAASLSECGMYDKETPATKEDIEYAFKAGVKFALGKQEKDAERSKEKLMCLRDRTKVCNRCHACDIDTDAWHSMYSR